MSNRSTTISIRISEAEKLKLEERASEAGKSVSNYFRDSVIALNARREVIGLKSDLESLERQRRQINSDITKAVEGATSRFHEFDIESQRIMDKTARKASQMLSEVDKTIEAAEHLQARLRKERLWTVIWSSICGAAIASMLVLVTFWFR